MDNKARFTTYIALLRGINVGGRHKVPMALLRSEMEKIGCSDVITLLNSGNVIFKSQNRETTELQNRIEARLLKVFGFEVPTCVLEAQNFKTSFESDPFEDEKSDSNTRFYVTFLGQDEQENNKTAYSNDSGSFRILSQKGTALCSVLDLGKVGTPDAMNVLEKMYGKEITTRNWNTVQKILKKLDARKP